jgi:hypothetical protein
MPAQIQDVDLLQNYIKGVMERADHHAGKVKEIVLALAGAIVWKKDPAPIEVHTKDGEMKNVLWVRINGGRYAFSYNHEASTIEMRQGTTQGQVVASFSNTTPAATVFSIFAGL